MQSRSRSDATDPATANGSGNWGRRFQQWVLSYGLHVETILVLVILVGAAVTAVVVIFGAILSLPTGSPPESGGGMRSVLDFGTLLLNGEIVLTVGLGLILIAHGVVEVRSCIRSDVGFDFSNDVDLTYLGIRLVQSVTALLFVGPIVVGRILAELGIIAVEPPTTLLWVLFASGLSMLVSVITHAVGRAVRSTPETSHSN